jgi:CheY-like chemotaxis protein
MPLIIVVADDDMDYRLIVGYLLASVSDMMTIVGEAADGEEALAVALRERPDIVITDLVMPRLNGIELTRRIRQEPPQTTIILMSSDDMSYREGRCARSPHEDARDPFAQAPDP